jgi:hypothetical protein
MDITLIKEDGKLILPIPKELIEYIRKPLQDEITSLKNIITGLSNENKRLTDIVNEIVLSNSKISQLFEDGKLKLTVRFND